MENRRFQAGTYIGLLFFHIRFFSQDPHHVICLLPCSSLTLFTAQPYWVTFTINRQALH
jgi:hypothetical protein